MAEETRIVGKRILLVSAYFALIILFVLCSAALAPAQTPEHALVTLSFDAGAVQETRNPDGRFKAAQAQSLPTPLATALDLHLSMILFVGSNSIAMINGKTLAQGQSAQVPAKDGTLLVKCLKINEDSVQISVDGDISRLSQAPAKPRAAAPVWRPPPPETKRPPREPKLDPIQDDRNLARRLQDRILAYHSGSPRNGRTVQVVYFYPCDRQLPNDYQGRISRVMLNIQEFYSSEMIRNGFMANNLFPLQMSGGVVVIHPVKGKDAERSYSYSSGKKIFGEIKKALHQFNFNPWETTTMIFNYLCCPTDDGWFCIHAPFFGGTGVAWAADADCMDAACLNDTVHRVFYTGTHAETWDAENDRFDKSKRTEQSIGQFNGIHIGSAAHELGHAMGLPHDGQTATQARQLGISLMGQGNWVYHQEQWKPKQKGAFLSLADSLRLAASPLFTQSDRGRDLHGRISKLKLLFGSNACSLTVDGKVESNLEVLALIAYSAPMSTSHHTYNDYAATTWVGEVRDGVFSITVGEHKAKVNDWRLQLAFVFINGKVFTMSIPYHCSTSGAPDVENLNATWRVNLQGYSGDIE